MKLSKSLIATFVALSLGGAVQAQSMGGLSSMMGGSKGGASAADPAKIEQDLKSIVETTSIALSKLADAMGDKEAAAKLTANADCIKAGSCGLSDSVGVVETAGASVAAEANKRKASGQKLDAESGRKAAAALLPAVAAFPLWKNVAEGAKGLDKSASMRFAGLMTALPKVPPAAKGTVDVVNAGIGYLAFSGVDTSEVSSAAAKTLKF